MTEKLSGVRKSRLDKIREARTLDDLYAIVPQPIDCTGECWDSCGPIGYSVEEGERMNAIGQRPPNAHEPRERMMCSALTDDHRCSVYNARPMICRVWGVSDAMPCPHGTTDKPCWTAFPLTRRESALLLARATELGGEPEGMRQHYKVKAADLMEVIRRGRHSWDL